MKRVVITGASGFLGGALASKFLNDGYDIFAVVRHEKKVQYLPRHKNLHPVVCDFSNYKNLSNYIDENIKYFIHLAWEGVAGAESQNVSVQISNIQAACAALEQANILRAERFLFAGSSYQYRMEPYVQNGQEKYVRKNIYGLAKQAAADLLRAMAIKNSMYLNTVLFTNVFGVGDHSMRSTNAFIRQLLEGKDLDLIDGRHKHDWTYIDDAIRGIQAVLEKGRTDTCYYIGKRNLMSFRDIITEVRDVLCPGAMLKFGCYDDKGYIDYAQIDLDELSRDTGFECKADFRDSILKTAEWLRSEMEKEKRVQ